MSSAQLKSGINNLLKTVKDERFLRTMYAMVSEYTGANDFELRPAKKKNIGPKKKSSHPRRFQILYCQANEANGFKKY